MPRRDRPQKTRRCEHWMRVAANEDTEALNRKVIESFGWSANEQISWLSPVMEDNYAEYYDQEFIDRLDLGNLKVPLSNFWPKSGAHRVGLARTESEKVIGEKIP